MRAGQVLISVLCSAVASNQFSKPDPTVGKPLKVLVSMTFGSRSHIKNVFEVGNVLQERGHDINYMTLEPYMRFAEGYNFTTHLIGPKGIEIDDKRGISELNNKPVNPLVDTLDALIEHLPTIYRQTFDDILNVIDNLKPDIMVCDFFSFPCIDAAYHRNIPLATGFQTLDGPILPPNYITGTLSYFPTTLDLLNFPQRFYSSVLFPMTIVPGFLKLNKMLNIERARYNLPTTHVVNVGNWDNSLKLFNTFTGFEPPRPLDPTMKIIGPIMSDKYTPLSNKLARFLDNRSQVLYIAFGSGVVLSPNDVQLLFQAVTQLVSSGKTDGVVWALGKTPRSAFNNSQVSIVTPSGKTLSAEDLLNNKHSMIKFINWAPQVAILNHEAVRVFLSHGGLESVFEAAYSGTPILTMPFFGDQYRNARKVVEMGFGGYTDRFTHTAKSISRKMSKMLEDKDGKIANSILHWQVIARMNSKRKYEAADILEEYAMTSKICNERPANTNTDIPCGMIHLVPGYNKMNILIAYGVDAFATLFVALIIAGFCSYMALRAIIRRVFVVSQVDEKIKIQ